MKPRQRLLVTFTGKNRDKHGAECAESVRFTLSIDVHGRSIVPHHETKAHV
jgi:hypothetical protein